MEEYLEFAKKLIKESGNIVLNHFGKVGVAYTKKHEGDVVTKADLESETHIISSISKQYPNHNILGEETGLIDKESRYTWVVDPLDGTRNFSTKTPLFGVMISLLYDRDPIVGCIYLPLTDELFYASKGGGAYLNGEKIFCSNKQEINESFGIMNSVFNSSYRNDVEKLLSDNHEASWISGSGCSAINFSFVASGRRDWHLTRIKSLWDISCGYLIAKEAGCVFVCLDGSEYKLGDNKKYFVANPVLAKKLVDKINS